MPTPIDRSQLSRKMDEAVPCWRFNTYRALDYVGCLSPITKVWATSTLLYQEYSDGVRSTAGVKSDDPVYATEAEAWEACIAEAKAWCDKRIKALEKMAREASDA